MSGTLLVAAGIHTVDPGGPPGARGLLVDGDRITWVGADPAQAPPHDRALDLGDAWITPALVDAHVHGTPTGLAHLGLDLRDAASAAEVLARLRSFAPTAGEVVLGHAWEDFGWPEGGPPTAAQIGAAAPGRTVLLTRVDGHSCLVSETVLERLPLERLDGVVRDAAGRPTGWLKEQASEAALDLVRSVLSAEELAAARAATCRVAASLGIGSVHEMGHPGLWGRDDALAWARGEWPVEVVTWWAELDLDAAVGHGLLPGGDLFLDGSIGSSTAAMSVAYGDDATTGELFHTDEAVAGWFADCTAAGVGGGVHAIGDRAIEQALSALERVARSAGLEAVRRCRHRIEHLEMPTPEQVRRMGRLGAVASVQPAFDALWGGPDRLYARRFGAAAACRSNPLAWLAAEGVPMAFGSDSTVTPLDPLAGIRAAVDHRGGLGIDAQTALAAHSHGGHFVAGRDDAGRCRPGYRADLAVWSGDPLGPAGAGAVRCASTMVRGVWIWGGTDGA